MSRPIIVLLLCFLVGSSSWTQQKDDMRSAFEELRKEIRMQIDSLKMSQGQLQGFGASEVDVVVERLERRLRELENKIDAVSRSTAPVVFNPRTTAFINFAARADDNTVLNDEGVAKIDNRLFLRTIELDLRAPVDPYAEAIAILAIEDETGTGFAVDPEEAYGLLKRLPILEGAPLGMKLKVGKFRAPLGVNNRLHMHDVPWTTRPLVVSKYLGTEHGDFFESGFNPVGLDLDFFVPNPISGTTLEMNVDIVRAGELALAQGTENSQPAFAGHLNLSADWNNEHLLILGASGYVEKGASPTSLLGCDLTYKWAPSERRASRSFVAGGEVFFGRRSLIDSLGSDYFTRPYGWFAYAQYQVSYWLYLGARYDWVQKPLDDTQETKALSVFASYYTTEFLRLRVGFERRLNDVISQPYRNTAHLEFNFVFGSHPTEPYWVNR